MWKRTYENRFFVPIVIFSVALLVRLLYIYLGDVEIERGDDPWYYLNIADNLLDGNGYFELNLRAYRPPCYPFFLAAILGLTHHSIEAVRVVQAMLAGFMCAGILSLGSMLVNRGVGLIAAVFCAVYPQLIHYAVQLWSEQLFLFLIIMALWFFLLSLRKRSLWLKVLSGALFGLASLTREAGLLVLAGILIWLVLNNKSLLAGLKKWWLIALCAFVVILPWTVRNYRVFAKFVPIATNGGINFYIGNNPEATGSFNWVIPPGATWNVASENGFYETQASSLGYKLGLKYIWDNPRRTLSHVFKRAYALFKPSYQSIDFSESIIETMTKLVWLLMYVILFLFAIIIAPFRLYYEREGTSQFLIIIVMLTLPFVIAYGATRYIVSLIPFMALAGAVPAWEFLSKRFALLAEIDSHI